MILISCHSIQGGTRAGLSLCIVCQLNLLAEKEVIASWIVAGDHSAEDDKRCFGYACTIIQYLKHIELSKGKVRTKFPTNLSISATIKSKVIKIKSSVVFTTCLECMFSLCLLCLPSCTHKAW